MFASVTWREVTMPCSTPYHTFVAYPEGICYFLSSCTTSESVVVSSEEAFYFCDNICIYCLTDYSSGQLSSTERYQLLLVPRRNLYIPFTVKFFFYSRLIAVKKVWAIWWCDFDKFLKSSSPLLHSLFCSYPTINGS